GEIRRVARARLALHPDRHRDRKHRRERSPGTAAWLSTPARRIASDPRSPAFRSAVDCPPLRLRVRTILIPSMRGRMGDNKRLPRRNLMAMLNVNGENRDVQAEPDTPLLWVIREQIGLTGTKFGCGIAQCGACSVHINGEVQRSCSLPLSSIK